jgi:hypothetical protein
LSTSCRRQREPHWTHIPADQHEAYVKRLGNLALLDRVLNEKSGNLPFAEKAEALGKSKISTTQEVATSTTWGPADIDERQKRMAKLAVRAWPLKPR